MTTEEFVKQLNSKEDYIILEGDRANDVYRIIATGNVAWAIAIGAIGLSAALIFITVGSGGAAAPVTVPVEVASKMFIAPAAIATLGWGATSTAIAICFAAGGVAAGKAILNSVRNNYKIAEKVENSDGKVTKLVLKRK